MCSHLCHCLFSTPAIIWLLSAWCCSYMATVWDKLIRRINFKKSRSQWPRGLRSRSAAARLLRLWVRIPPGAWICCECCQVEVSATSWPVVQRSPTDCVVWSRNRLNEKALAKWGQLRRNKKKSKESLDFYLLATLQMKRPSMQVLCYQHLTNITTPICETKSFFSYYELGLLVWEWEREIARKSDVCVLTKLSINTISTALVIS
jgi:hypothetical protein